MGKHERIGLEGAAASCDEVGHLCPIFEEDVDRARVQGQPTLGVCLGVFLDYSPAAAVDDASPDSQRARHQVDFVPTQRADLALLGSGRRCQAKEYSEWRVGLPGPLDKQADVFG